MQQYDSNKKKRKLTLLISYIAMTLAVVAISIVCVMLVLGYRFDPSSKKLEQGALLQFGTSPSGAQIILDGEQLTFSTNGKREVAAGLHEVVYKKEGYRDWSTSFSIKAGELRWLNYARMIPTTIKTNTIKEVGSLAENLPSPNKKYIAYLSSKENPEVVLVNVNDSKKPESKTVNIPQANLRQDVNARSYSLVEWSASSKYMLVKHSFEGGMEFIRISPDTPEDIVNISSRFGVQFTELHFSKDSVFYGVENGNLRKIDLSAGSMSEPIAKGVVGMQLHGADDIAFITHSEARYDVSVSFGGEKPKAVSSYDDTVPLLIDVGKYFNDRYLAIARGASFELIKSPEKTADDGMKKIATFSYPIDLKWLDISENGRFVITGSNARFATYDIELAKNTESNFPSLLSDPTIRPQWLDEFMLVSTGDNKIRISDFDGENQQIIVDALPAQPVMLSSNGRLLYSFSKSTDGVVKLQSSELTVVDK